MKNLIVVAALAFVAAGCESMHSDNDPDIMDHSTGINEPSGTQSFSSNPTQSSSSSNVGQSGNIIPSATEPSDSGTATNTAPRNDSPQ